MSRKTSTFGTCRYVRMSPARESLSPETPALNLFLPFDEALRLRMALEAGTLDLQSYNRATREGREAGLNVTVHLALGRITVNPARVATRRVRGPRIVQVSPPR